MNFLGIIFLFLRNFFPSQKGRISHRLYLFTRINHVTNYKLNDIYHVSEKRAHFIRIRRGPKLFQGYIERDRKTYRIVPEKCSFCSIVRFSQTAIVAPND